MWCPKCKIEYRDGIMVCADCGTPLEPGSAKDFDVVAICSLKDGQMAERFVEYLEYSNIAKARIKEGEEPGIYTVTVPASMEKKAEKLFQGFMLAIGEEQEKEEARQSIQEDTDFGEETAWDTAEELGRGDSGADRHSAEGNFTEEDSEEGDLPEMEEYDWDAEEDEPQPGMSPFDTGDVVNLVSGDDVGEAPQNLLHASSKEYVKKEDEYKDLKFSGLTFILFGIAGLIYLALCRLDIIPISYNIVVFVCIAVMFLVFIVLGISSMVKSGKVKEQIPLEEETTRQIKGWLKDNLTDEIIEGWKDTKVSEAENDLLLMAHIRASLMKQFPDVDVSYLEMLSEEYYNENMIEGGEEEA